MDSSEVRQKISRFQENFQSVQSAVSRVLVGHGEIIEGTLIALFAGGHVLLEGLPGLGKTLFVRTFAQVLELSCKRVQFTPDLMPGDITGMNALIKTEREPVISFEKGPVFTNILLADEINRATPRTQSALLEAMQENSVTTGGTTHALPSPFMVIATQNPIEMEGTYPLPEAQLDRFFFKFSVALPNLEELMQIADRTTGEAVPPPNTALATSEIRAMKELVPQVCIASYLLEYAARLILSTHPQGAIPEVRKYVRYGASPRGLQALVLGAKARALVKGREHVAQEDIDSVLLAALRHRILINFEGEAEGMTSERIVEQVNRSVRARSTA